MLIMTRGTRSSEEAHRRLCRDSGLTVAAPMFTPLFQGQGACLLQAHAASTLLLAHFTAAAPCRCMFGSRGPWPMPRRHWHWQHTLQPASSSAAPPDAARTRNCSPPRGMPRPRPCSPPAAGSPALTRNADSRIGHDPAWPPRTGTGKPHPRSCFYGIPLQAERAAVISALHLGAAVL